MADNVNTEYEKLTQEIYKAINIQEGIQNVDVQHNVKIEGKSGCKHQSDVYWEFMFMGETHKVAIECKNLFFAKTSKEIAEQLLEFKGEIRNGKPDRLKKHMDRVEILLKNKTDLLRFCGFSNIDVKIHNYVLFSNPVPMLYDSSIPKGVKFAAIQEIKEKKTLE